MPEELCFIRHLYMHNTCSLPQQSYIFVEKMASEHLNKKRHPLETLKECLHLLIIIK